MSSVGSRRSPSGGRGRARDPRSAARATGLPARPRTWLLALALLVTVLCAYRPAWSGKPVWDDDGHMTRPELRSGAGLVLIWTELGATQQYYPLVHTAFWLEHRLFGDATTGYHLISILLHAASALLLVAILRRLAVPGAWLAGWLFALHPVMVESVAWITELKNTLSGVFFLGAAFAYLTFDRTRAPKHYIVALATFSCGLLAKSAIATLPGALLVVLWWMRGRIGWRRDVLPLLPWLAIGTTSGLLTAWIERRFIGAVGSAFNLAIADRFLIAGRAIWFYLSKLLFPAELVFIYPRWNLDAKAAWQYLFPVTVLIVAALFYRMRGRSPGPLAALLYFVITLFPALGFFNIYPFRYSFVADHFQYLAAIGPMTAAAAGIRRATDLMADRIRRVARPLMHAVLLAVLFSLSWRQSGMFADAATLYQTTIDRNPECWMAHYNLGILLAKAGRFDEAKGHYLKTLKLKPDHAKAHINVGIVLARTGNPDAALAHYRDALQINPSSAEAYYNQGYVLSSAGRAIEAGASYRKALEIEPNHADAHNNLGLLLAGLGRADDAVTHYKEALQIRPDDDEIHNNLGVVLAKLGQTDDAMAHFEVAARVNASSADAHNNLGILLAKRGRSDEAAAHYRKALLIDPSNVQARSNLSLLLRHLPAQTGP
jgi:protein O-mannosyl-transferase